MIDDTPHIEHGLSAFLESENAFIDWFMDTVFYVDKYSYIPGGYNLYTEHNHYILSIMNLRDPHKRKWKIVTELLGQYFERNGAHTITTTKWRRKDCNGNTLQP